MQPLVTSCLAFAKTKKKGAQSVRLTLRPSEQMKTDPSESVSDLLSAVLQLALEVHARQN